MPIHRLAPLRAARPALGVLVACLLVVSSCGSTTPTGGPDGSSAASVVPSVPFSGAPTPAPTDVATPVPTPSPTPSYTNPPDPDLERLIPDSVAGREVHKPKSSEYGVTPGDVASAYGDLGVRFRSLAIAYVEPRLLSLYALRVDGEAVTTADLRPYLATAGQYVGIAGLHPEAWKRARVAGHDVWSRPEDNATAAGTMIYTWAADDHYVFLMIGTDRRVNRAMLQALPGDPPPPKPSRSASPTPAASGSVSPSSTPSATPVSS